MISLIAAMDQNHVIGFENDMPWHLPRDLKFFKDKTTGHPIIMGRKTFESIGRPLPNRKNIVLSRTQTNFPKEIQVIQEIDTILKWNHEQPDEEYFIIGGGNLYQQAISYADRMYITKINEEFKGDTYFPHFSEADWTLTNQMKGFKDEKNPYDYYFLQYDRNK